CPRAARETFRDRTTSTSRAGTERVQPQVRLRRGGVLSFLALRAPVGHPCVVALRPRLDRRSATRAHVAVAPVDVPRAWYPVDARRQRRGGRGEDGAQLVAGHACEPAPRRDSLCPQRLGLPDVADPGDEPLVEYGVADGAVLRCCTETRQHRLVVGRL